MRKITSSYQYLNKKYDLNFSDYNYGFDWNIFKELVTDEYAEFFTTTCYHRWAPTSRDALKTWNVGYFELFLACNFTDTSTADIRRYVNTHDATTFSQLINACEYLLDKYNIDLGPGNKNGIKWPDNVKNGGEIVFPSGVRIRFTGYANSSNIMGGTVRGNGFLGCWTDEIIIPDEKEILTDEQLDGRYTRLQSSFLRSKLIKISYEKQLNQNGEYEYNLDKPIPIKEWSWTFIDRITKKETTRYFYKTFFNIFTCNPYDKHHHFYKKYVTPFLPLTDKIMEKLKQNGKVWYENQEAFGGMGIFILRLTAEPNWNKLPEITRKNMLAHKETNPAEFFIEFYGFEYASTYDKLFPFRKHLKYLQKYDLQEFYVKSLDMYKFDFYSMGLDWATGPTDDSVIIFLGFKKYQDTNLYDPYIISEFIVKADESKSEPEKINYFVNELLGLYDNFNNFKDAVLHYDDHAKTATEWIKNNLLEKHNKNIRTKTAIKHQTSLNKEAGLTDRVTWLRNIFGFGNVYCNLKENPNLQECLEELRFDENKTNVPDPKMYQDPYDALFYGMYPYKNLIRGKRTKI